MINNHLYSNESRKNNFDFLRLIFASFVIITHSYPLSGSIEYDLIGQLTNGQYSFSYIGVKGFFVISGYLIFQSLLRSKNIVNYYKKRLLRLYPALFVVLLLTLILAPIVYEGNYSIFNNKSFWTYLPNNLLFYKLQYSIDGIFENNKFKSGINGSLWTIRFEFTLYVIISFLIIFKKNKRLLKVALILLFFLFFVSYVVIYEQIIYYIESIGKIKIFDGVKNLLDLGLFFIGGSVLAAFDFEKIKSKERILILIFIFLLLSFYFDILYFTIYFCFPILIIVLGLYPIPYLYKIGHKIGDLSYGIYIYGFPVQQTLMYYYKLTTIELMIYSMIISYIFAYFSWHVVEKKALKLK